MLVPGPDCSLNGSESRVKRLQSRWRLITSIMIATSGRFHSIYVSKVLFIFFHKWFVVEFLRAHTLLASVHHDKVIAAHDCIEVAEVATRALNVESGNS